MEEIKKVEIKDKEYPAELKKIKNPPALLYYQGILPRPEEICIAIVGTRKCTDYGKEVALKISHQLSEAGVVIVSGLAPGIDTFAHKAVIERKGRAIAVLGTGLDKKSIYPKQNLPLIKKILEYGGCIISELAPGTPGSKFSFPQRNRIISGLSKGVVIVEAKEKSGSLITAKFALQQNKKLFAVPGSIFSPNSQGTNSLLKQGAILVQKAQDILSLFEIKNNLKKEKIIKGESLEEDLILKALISEALSIDKIIEKTKLNSSVVNSTLALLEISGKIRDLGGGVYCLN